MKVDIWMKLKKNPKMSEYLKENSEWYKYLNRSPINYNYFIKNMKEQYRTRTTDKISDLMDNIEIISNVLKVLK